MHTFFGGAAWAGLAHCQMVLQLHQDLGMLSLVLMVEQSEQGWAAGLTGHPWVGSHHQSSSCHLCQQPHFFSFLFFSFLFFSFLFFSFHFINFISYLIVWSAEPVVTHQTSWPESTGVCGVRATKPLLRISPFTQKRDHDHGRTWHGRCCCSGGKAM